ncbi:MAG: hypothetical protein JOZ55_07025 [Alphaproteobacteria bacterium]|nr:hypothetical protein [Alphaproteobacteria bacterium]
MSWFRNTAVNLISLHYVLFALAANAGGLFIPVWLLKAGVPLPGVFLAMASITAGRFVVRPLVLVTAIRSGLRFTAVLGAAAMGFIYLPVAFIHGTGAALIAYCAISAVADAFYWTSFHALFATLGDNESRGRQTSMREALGTLVGILAPVAGGMGLARYGAGLVFPAVAAIQLLSAVPLLGVPVVKVAPKVEGGLRAARIGAVLFAVDGWNNATFVVAWQLLLFLVLSKDILAFGGAMAFAALTGAATGIALGRHIDLGGGRSAVWMSVGALAAAIVARAASASFPLLAVGANAFGAFAACIYYPTLLTATYNAAKSAPCSLRFHIAAEGGADAGFTAGSLIIAGLVALRLPLSLGVSLAIAGPAVSFVVLGRYYGRIAAGEDR